MVAAFVGPACYMVALPFVSSLGGGAVPCPGKDGSRELLFLRCCPPHLRYSICPGSIGWAFSLSGLLLLVLQKGHIRTHRECPLYGQLLTPTEGKPPQGEPKKDMGAGTKGKPGAGAPKGEKQKEVLPSDEDEPILSRKKGPPAQKVSWGRARIFTLCERGVMGDYRFQRA